MVATIQWSASSGHMSVGVALSYEGDPNRGWVNIHAIVYARSDGYGHNYSSTWAWWGDPGSGSESFSFSSGHGATVTKVISDWRFSVWTDYGKAKWVKVGASLGPIWNGGNPSVEAWIQVPAKAYDAPTAPTSVQASRVSDSQVNLSWSLTSTSAAPVESIAIERKSAADPVWRRVANLQTPATSWSDTTVKPNDRYTYSIQAANSSYGGAWSEYVSVSTTPAAPTGVQAVKQQNGSIVVSWKNAAPYDGAGWIVYDNGTKVEEVGASTKPDVSWTHVSPSTLTTHTYTVAMKEGGLVSARSAPSNTVQLLAAPNAPMGLAPAGVVTPGATRLSWQHNPVDSSAQTKAEIEWRVDGGSWTTVMVASSVQHADVTLPVGTVEWRVRTWGAFQSGQSSGASPWSAVSTLRVADTPGVSISSPANSSTINVSRLTVSWTYYQTQSSGQAAAEIALVDEAGHVVESQTIQGAGTSFTFSSPLSDAASYTVKVRVRCGYGLWSKWTQARFTVSFPPPPVPKAEALWDEGEGAATISITNVAPLDPSQVVVNLAYNPRMRGGGGDVAPPGVYGLEAGTSTRVHPQSGGGAEIEIVKESKAFISQGGMPLQRGKAYALRFEARGDIYELNRRPFVQHVVAPYTNVYPEESTMSYVEGVNILTFTIPNDESSWPTNRGIFVIGTPKGVGTKMVIDKIAVFGPFETESEAREIGRDYFDGSSGPNSVVGGQSYEVRWSGAEDRSTSVGTPNSPAAVSNLIERSVDGGVSWEVIAEGVAVSSSVLDRESLSAGTTLYRVSAMTDLPSSSSALIELNADSDAVWISGGDGFSLAVPLEWDPQHSTSVGLVNRKVHHFAGRRLGVEMAGTQRRREVQVSATLLDERLDLVDRLEELSYMPGPFLYRDPLGRRIYGSLSGVQMSREIGGKWGVQATVEEVGR